MKTPLPVKSPFDTVLELFGIGKMPWVIRAYLLLFFVFIGLLVYSSVETAQMMNPPDTHPLVRLFSFAQDYLKVIIGALLGSLSLAGERLFQGREQPREAAAKPPGV